MITLSMIFFPYFISLVSSPFYIPYPNCKDPSLDDYLKIEALKETEMIQQKLFSLYEEERTYLQMDPKTFSKYREEVLLRMELSLKGRLTDPKKLEFPQTHLIKINQGSSRVVVTCVGFGDRRPSNLLNRIEKELRASGFNGYFYYRIGGYPTPRGVELSLSATPYAFKIFMMEEAKELGFDHVLWLDARLIPLKDISPLFEILEKENGFFNLADTLAEKKVFSSARKTLFDLSKKNYFDQKAISTPVFGLNMHHKVTENLIDDFYEACRLGVPFLSCYPEETVLSTLIAKHFPKAIYLKEHSPWVYSHLFYYSHGPTQDQKIAVNAKKKGWFFFGISNEGVSQIDQIRIPNFT
ncbi:MAG: hypothetical protein FJZ60_01845 [Chlamydiae bacterium]|nr:hypothetical protein [Chlamydiota bacterium]